VRLAFRGGNFSSLNQRLQAAKVLAHQKRGIFAKQAGQSVSNFAGWGRVSDYGRNNGAAIGRRGRKFDYAIN
jgi:hypothetical protein